MTGPAGQCERLRPAALAPGDRVVVVAPSGPVEPSRLEPGCALLRRLGLDVVTGAHVLDRAGYLAGRDADRADDLQRAWCDRTTRAVICARGGYGATRLLDHLDWEALAAAEPKILHGSSDITALHAAFGRRLGAVTSFGPMVASALLGSVEPDPISSDHLRNALLSQPETCPFDGRASTDGGHSTVTVVGGRARGRLVGGNLTMLAALAGTPYAPPAATGDVMLLEDVGEHPYRIDRALTQLLQAGQLDGAAGLVLGSWVDCGDPAEVVNVLTERLAPLGVPTLAGLPIGHGAPQLTVPLGAEVELDADAGVLAWGSRQSARWPSEERNDPSGPTQTQRRGW